MSDNGFRLRISKGEDVGSELVVLDPAEGPVKIGRGVDPESDMLINDVKVSRHHATIELTDQGIVIVDKGSMNRTRVNGRLLKADEPEVLQDGDEILIGPDSAIVFELLKPRPTADPVEQRPPRYLFDHYGIYHALAKGEIDRVDVAVDTRTGKRVALKRFANELSRVIRQRIVDQALKAKRFRHPNIAEIIDVGQVDDVAYIASRLVDGLSLDKVLEHSAAQVAWPLACYIVREACNALAYAQTVEPGFVHRNLTPRSIMVDYTGEIAMVHFGLTPVQAMRTGTVKLNPQQAYYLAPEHRAQRALDPRSDVFSLGIILYELLTKEAIDPRRMGNLPDIEAICPELPGDLARMAMTSIAQRPEDRPQTIDQMAQQLTVALDIMAPRFGPAEVASWMIRQRLGAWG